MRFAISIEFTSILFSSALCSTIVINCWVIGACCSCAGLLSCARAFWLKNMHNVTTDSNEAELLFVFIDSPPSDRCRSSSAKGLLFKGQSPKEKERLYPWGTVYHRRTAKNTPCKVRRGLLCSVADRRRGSTTSCECADSQISLPVVFLAALSLPQPFLCGGPT